MLSISNAHYNILFFNQMRILRHFLLHLMDLHIKIFNWKFPRKTLIYAEFSSLNCHYVRLIVRLDNLLYILSEKELTNFHGWFTSLTLFARTMNCRVIIFNSNNFSLCFLFVLCIYYFFDRLPWQRNIQLNWRKIKYFL